MAGVVFIISVPNEEKEKILALRKTNKKCPLSENKNCASNGFLRNQTKKFTSKDVGKTERTTLLRTKSNISEYVYETDNKDIQENSTSMEMMLEDILREFKIENSVWSNTRDGHYVQIMFTMESGEDYEKILNLLKENEIGSKYNSVVSVTPCTLYYKRSTGQTEEFPDDNDNECKDSMWTQFVLSVRARPTVAQVVENIKSHAILTFDYVCLLIVATTVCAIGLVENNNVYLLSSMLISPMMGPVLAATFGAVIRDRALQKIGVQSELLGLGIAVMVGFCYGTIICLSTDKYGDSDWPTNEMIVRGQLRTLGVGCLIAILSGAALALGLLSDNVASLVGVAISTSLMPPAVNAGLLWSLAAIYYLKGNDTTRYSTLSYTNFFSEDRGTEITCLGCMSLCLTLLNIVFIYIAGIVIFKIKEVAPMASRDHLKRHFWKHEVKISRDHNKRGCLHRSIDLSQPVNHLNRMIVTKPQYTWSPCMNFAIKPSVKELQEIYFNQMMTDKSGGSKTMGFTKSPVSPSRNAPLGYSPFHNDVTICVPTESENNKRRAQSIDGSKKFLVTPSIENIKF